MVLPMKEKAGREQLDFSGHGQSGKSRICKKLSGGRYRIRILG
jgi:hypothetical protein